MILIALVTWVNAASPAAVPPRPIELKTGDIVLQASQSGMAESIRKATRSPYSHVGEAFSKDLVVQKISKIGQKHVELGNLAKSRASSDEVRRFGNKLVKDSEGLAKTVQKYAKDNKINMAAAPYVSGSSDVSGSAESSGSPARSGTMGGTGHDDTIAGKDLDMSGTVSDQYGQTGAQRPADDFQQKLADLRSLQGTEFDSQFLSNVVEGSERALTKLQGWKGQGDSGLDRLIDRAMKTIGDHQREAMRLQGKVPSA